MVQVAADAEGEVDYVSCGVLVVYTYVEEGRKVGWGGLGWTGCIPVCMLEKLLQKVNERPSTRPLTKPHEIRIASVQFRSISERKYFPSFDLLDGAGLSASSFKVSAIDTLVLPANGLE